MSRMNYMVAVVALAVTPMIIPLTPDPVYCQNEAVPRIALTKAKSMLGNPRVLFVDVRTARDIAESGDRIPGAPWEDSHNVAAWASSYPKDKTIVFYCA